MRAYKKTWIDKKHFLSNPDKFPTFDVKTDKMFFLQIKLHASGLTCGQIISNIVYDRLSSNFFKVSGQKAKIIQLEKISQIRYQE